MLQLSVWRSSVHTYLATVSSCTHILNYNPLILYIHHTPYYFPQPTSYSNHYLPVHVTPSPLYPVLQVHSKLPALFAQAAFVSQLWVPSVHSSMSARNKRSGLRIISTQRVVVCQSVVCEFKSDIQHPWARHKFTVPHLRTGMQPLERH